MLFKSLGFISRQSCSCMSLAHSRQVIISLFSQDLPTYLAMLDIWACAVAIDTWGIGHVYADVMQQSPILDKLSVEVELRMCIHYPEGFVSHVATVLYQQSSQLGFLCILFPLGIVFIK